MVPATAVAALGIVSTRWQASVHVNAIPGMVDVWDNGQALVDRALETLVFRIASGGEQASDDVGLGISVQVILQHPPSLLWLGRPSVKETPSLPDCVQATWAHVCDAAAHLSRARYLPRDRPAAAAICSLLKQCQNELYSASPESLAALLRSLGHMQQLRTVLPKVWLQLCCNVSWWFHSNRLCPATMHPECMSEASHPTPL